MWLINAEDFLKVRQHVSHSQGERGVVTWGVPGGVPGGAAGGTAGGAAGGTAGGTAGGAAGASGVGVSSVLASCGLALFCN